TIYRIVVTLTEMQYLKKVGRNEYELGPKVLSNGFVYLSSRDIVQVAAPFLSDLRDETSASCHLAIKENLDAIYIYQAQSPQLMAVNVRIGTRFPCHTVAIGRALLWGLSDEALNSHFAGVAFDASYPPGPRSLPELRMLLAKEREQGYSENHSHSSVALANPVTNYASQVVAAINVSIPEVVIEDIVVKRRLIELLQETARAISQALGG
ncbi:MAG: IclR family transcriptional regulator, partial [Desulfarculaceae bacterium]